MKNIKFFLILFSIIFIITQVVQFIILKDVNSGNVSNTWIVLLTLVMVVALITNLVLTFQYSRSVGRNTFVWVALALFFPYIAPIILAFLPQNTYRPLRMKNNLAISQNVLEIKGKKSRTSVCHLDSLRITALRFPENSKWRVLFSTKKSETFFFDLLSEKEFENIIEILSTLEEVITEHGSKNISERDMLYALEQFKLYFVDYNSNIFIISMKDLKLNDIDLLGKLSFYRKDRIKKLNIWKEKNREVKLKGFFGKEAILNKEGYKKGTRFLPWSDVASIYGETHESLFSSSTLYILPENIKTGLYSFKKIPYGMRIPTKSMDLYQIECSFFQSLFYYEGSTIDAEQLFPIMADKVICSNCGTVSPFTDTKRISECCKKPLIQFCKAEKSQKCNYCSFSFSDDILTLGHEVFEVLEKKGLCCSKCGKLYCINCAPKNFQGELSFVCTCGGYLEIRL